MTKFEPAIIPESEIQGTAFAWMKLWHAGDKNTLKVTGQCSALEAYKKLLEFARFSAQGNVFLNNKYQVIRRDLNNGMVHLSIKLLSKSHEHDWRDYQQIKNELVGEECEAMEIYPAESRLVDCANQWHIWAWTDTTYRIPIGFTERCVGEAIIGKSQQRPFEKKPQ